MVRTASPGAERPSRPSEVSTDLSPLTLTVNPVRRAGGLDALAILLQRARAAGVTSFDTVGAADPELAETCLARAFPEGDPRIVVITAGPSAEAPGRLPRPSRRGVFVPAVGSNGQVPAGNRSGPRFRRLFEVDASGAPPQPGDRAVVGPPRAEAQGSRTALRCRSQEDVVSVARRPGPLLLSGAYSLLDRTIASDAERLLGPGGFTWIARDPFAGGRLDGGRFIPGSTAGSMAPRTVRELEADFGPVRRLGFLVRRGQRTLSQAALHFVAGTPWVATTVLAIPTPERWSEILGYASSPPLDPAERARVEALAGAPRPGAREAV